VPDLSPHPDENPQKQMPYFQTLPPENRRPLAPLLLRIIPSRQVTGQHEATLPDFPEIINSQGTPAESKTLTRFIRELRKFAKERGMDISKFI
jgi:hypothetical protein